MYWFNRYYNELGKDFPFIMRTFTDRKFLAYYDLYCCIHKYIKISFNEFLPFRLVQELR